MPLGLHRTTTLGLLRSASGLLDLGQTFLHSFIPLQEVALLLMREFKTPSSQSEISLRRSLFTWLVLRCQ